jgi:prepilin peptidase CpaA
VQEEVTLFTGSMVREVGGVLFTTLLGVACVTDIRSRRIPNVLVLVLSTSGLVFSMLVEPVRVGLVHSMSGLGLGFAIWIGFYALGLLGAGDVKLFAAAGAWLGPGGAWRAALLSALAGGVLALVTLVRQRRAGEGLRNVALSVANLTTAPLKAGVGAGGVGEAGDATRHLPYGVALALGALAAAWIPGLLVV